MDKLQPLIPKAWVVAIVLFACTHLGALVWFSATLGANQAHIRADIQELKAVWKESHTKFATRDELRT